MLGLADVYPVKLIDMHFPFEDEFLAGGLVVVVLDRVDESAGRPFRVIMAILHLNGFVFLPELRVKATGCPRRIIFIHPMSYPRNATVSPPRSSLFFRP